MEKEEREEEGRLRDKESENEFSVNQSLWTKKGGGGWADMLH